jgi:hypothetical protein
MFHCSYRQPPIVRHPFCGKQSSTQKYIMGAFPQIRILLYVMTKSSLQFHSARALKKDVFAGVEVPTHKRFY